MNIKYNEYIIFFTIIMLDLIVYDVNFAKFENISIELMLKSSAFDFFNLFSEILFSISVLKTVSKVGNI